MPFHNYFFVSLKSGPYGQYIHIDQVCEISFRKKKYPRDFVNSNIQIIQLNVISHKFML